MSPEVWLKIEAVFQEAADLPPHERAQYLDRTCGLDAALRAEVERLLQNDAAAGDFIESPVWSESALFTTSSKKDLSASVEKELGTNGGDDLLGKQVGVWRLTRELGRGGMGAVYLAERSDGEFRQRAAIKLIKRGMDSDFIIRRFRHERQILASFEHPFIARLLDGGTTTEGIPYFVMEYIEGDTLYNYCDAKSLSVRDRLKIFQKVCAAIQYAHERQIVHRDIKPGNILIGISGTPKLLDFGIAKILDSDLIHESVNPTASMLRMMTPDYASPEQVQGVEVTPASDIYSLGVLLYELLTGHRPYNFDGRSLHEVSRVICEVTPMPPSKAIFESSTLLKRYADRKSRFLDTRRTDQRQLVQELERNLDDVVMKAIAKEPTNRYSSAKDLSEDISRHLNGTRVSAPTFVAAPVRTDAAVKKDNATKALAVLPFKYLNLGSTPDTDDRFLAVGLADALIARLSKIRRFSVRPTGSILSFIDEHTDPVRAGQTLNVDLILDGNIKRAGNRLRVSVQLLDVKSNAAIWATSIDETVADVLTLETILANKVIDVLLPQLTGSELEEFAKRGTDDPDAFEHYLRGRYHFNRSTEEGFAQAFVEFHAAIASDPKYALAYCGIADYYNWLGIIGVLPPQECFQPAIQAASTALELDPASSEAHASLAFSLHAGKYDWARAERHFQNALELNANNANAYVWYSIVLFTVGRFDEGLKLAQQSIDLDPLTPFNHHNLGWGLYFARRFDEAARQYEKVVAEFPTYNFGHYGLSKIYRITGRTEDAITENAKALELTGNSVFAMLSDAECYAADGQAALARQKLSALEELSKTRYVSPYQMALGYCFLKDKRAALKHLETGLQNNEAWLNWMGVEPALDILREEPRFQSILEKIGYASVFSDESAQTRATGFARDQIHELTTMRIIAGDETEDGTREVPRRLWTRRVLIASAIAMLLIIGFVGIAPMLRSYESQQRQQLTAFQNRSVVILPFRSKDPDDNALGIGLADALTGKLGTIKSLEMIAANAGRAVVGADPAQIGADLRAAYLLDGEISTSGGQTLIAARLVSTSDGNTVWSDTVNAPQGDFVALQTALAEKVWTALGIQPLTLELNELRKPYTSSTEAYRSYLIGRTQMTDRSRDNLRRSIGTFSHAIAADPDFALAYAGLADAHALLNLYDIQPPPDAYPKARSYAKRALELDDGLAEAHASLGYVKFYYERDRQGAELEFRRAIQLNPSYAQARHWFALALAAMGKNVEALNEAEFAKRLDPLSPSIRSATGIIYFMGGKSIEAISACDEALAIDSTFVPAYKVKRWVYDVMKDPVNARAAFGKELEFSRGSLDDPGWRVIDLQLRGLTGETSESEVEQLVAANEIRSNPFFFSFEVALAFNATGDTSRALDWIERADASGNHSFNFLAVDPRLYNLHSEPRFQKLLAKLR